MGPSSARIAAGLIALAAGTTHATTSPSPRNYTLECRQLDLFSRDFSSPTRSELASLQGFLKKLVGGSDDPTALTSRFESAAAGPHDVVYMFVKTDHLWPGDVSIRDEVSKQSVSRRSRFRIVE